MLGRIIAFFLIAHDYMWSLFMFVLVRIFRFHPDVPNTVSGDISVTHLCYIESINSSCLNVHLGGALVQHHVGKYDLS